jgi:hypothetical protein
MRTVIFLAMNLLLFQLIGVNLLSAFIERLPIQVRLSKITDSFFYEKLIFVLLAACSFLFFSKAFLKHSLLTFFSLTVYFIIILYMTLLVVILLNSILFMGSYNGESFVEYSKLFSLITLLPATMIMFWVCSLCVRINGM